MGQQRIVRYRGLDGELVGDAAARRGHAGCFTRGRAVPNAPDRWRGFDGCRRGVVCQPYYRGQDGGAFGATRALLPLSANLVGYFEKGIEL